MASKGETDSLSEEVICPVCLDFFTDPIILECGHNFCRSCITQYWEREERNSCPECREEFADRTLRVNRALANLTQKVRNLSLNPKGKESKRHCEEHEEELKLFCETDKTLICMICAVAEEHREHRFRPIKEAVKKYMDQLKSSLDSLTKKESDFQEKEQQQKEKISGVREQSHSLQSHITSQFAELRQIITEKEQSLLRDLREEEKRILNPMEKNLLALQENIRIIQEEITKLKEQMDQKDSVIFLKEEARRNRRINDDVQELSVTDETLPVEKFDHLYLLNTVLRETLDAINRVSENERRSHGNTKFFQGSTGRSERGCFPCSAENPCGDICFCRIKVSVTLDVETANPELEVSEDRKSVRGTETWRNLPDTGKRFTYWACVLGSEGFTSGRHYWEVEVTGNRFWWLGVAAESVKRKRRVSLSPETGFWVIRRVGDVLYRDYDVSRVLPSPGSRLAAGPIPGRVGVYLSYESGTVSFYNAETKSHLHTFTGNKFTGKLYPFFATWDRNQWLRICSGSAPGL
ncbi:E3 ubiquitin-protein ligase TRIM39-like [Hypanus sabinus]|uniref:E3 ubiquitin-protein ligase TRIM39-like n=1 Tax=Hypanus sabinus TaxID=79690 RepID=UPI0028C49ABC|nr:E3 ubiquitin-protein ligase TRIM39-like [Hypanus sabinus]